MPAPAGIIAKQMSALGKVSAAPDYMATGKRDFAISLMRSAIRASSIRPEFDSLLIVGASRADVALASSLGFKNITPSGLSGSGYLNLDAENISIADNSYDVVFAHAMLHHCACPQKALAEGLRVARKGFMFLEGNDSLVMRLAVLLGFHNPYELGAVIGNKYQCGGLRDTPVPNYIYRWNKRDVMKAALSAFPQLNLNVYAKGFFEFYLSPDELAVRQEKPIRIAKRVLGTGNCVRLLRLVQSLSNTIPPVRSQGNHFFALVTKNGFKPWIENTPDYLGLKRPASQ